MPREEEVQGCKPERDDESQNVKNLSVFEYIDEGFPLLQTSDVKQKLLQWNLNQSLTVRRFRVKRKVSAADDDGRLVNDFFHDPEVQSQLSHSGAWQDRNDKKPLQCRPLKITVTSLAFFDTLRESGLVSTNGSFRRCVDEIFDGATASDLVKESFINPDSEGADVFTVDQQRELIFQLFRAFVIGGSMCQSDDAMAPYEDMTKRFYKALVSIKKNEADPGVIDIASRAYQITDPALFPSTSPFHTCFVIVDAKKRWITVWHNAFLRFW